MGRLNLEMWLGRLGMKQKKDKCADEKIVCLEGVVLCFDMVVDGDLE